MKFYTENGVTFEMAKRFEVVLREAVDENDDEYEWKTLMEYEYSDDSRRYTVSRIERRNDSWELFRVAEKEISPWEAFQSLYAK